MMMSLVATALGKTAAKLVRILPQQPRNRLQGIHGISLTRDLNDDARAAFHIILSPN
jgi:hypothetical protein